MLCPPLPLAHQVTLQELSNLERFVKRNGNENAGPDPPATERLLKEETYLKSRLVFVQQVGSGLGSGLGLGLRRGLGLGLWDWGGTGTGLGYRGPELTSGCVTCACAGAGADGQGESVAMGEPCVSPSFDPPRGRSLGQRTPSGRGVRQAPRPHPRGEQRSWRPLPRRWRRRC